MFCPNLWPILKTSLCFSTSFVESIGCSRFLAVSSPGFALGIQELPKVMPTLQGQPHPTTDPWLWGINVHPLCLIWGKLWRTRSISELPTGLAKALCYDHITAQLLPLPNPASLGGLVTKLYPTLATPWTITHQVPLCPWNSPGKKNSPASLTPLIMLILQPPHPKKKLVIWPKEYIIWGTSLAVQWLRLYAPSTGGTDSIPSWGIKIPYATQCSPPLPQNICIYVCIYIHIHIYTIFKFTKHFI